MNTKRSLKVIGLIGALALVSATYCFWLMTIPLSYDLVYVVVAGFIVSLGVVIFAFIRSLILVSRLRGSRRDPQVTPRR